MQHLVSSLGDAVVLLLQVRAQSLGVALASLRLVLPRYHLLQLSVRQLVLLPAAASPWAGQQQKYPSCCRIRSSTASLRHSCWRRNGRVLL